MLSLLWLRRDLRLYDHAPLAKALSFKDPVQPVFIFDTDILERFSNPEDRRLTFIAEALCELDSQLQQRGGGLLILHGSARKIVPELAKTLSASRVICGEDYEPFARSRDESVKKALHQAELIPVVEHLLLPPYAVKKPDGSPYRVFTPFSKAWYLTLKPEDIEEKQVKDKGRYADFQKLYKAAQATGFKLLDASAGPASLLDQIGYRHVPLKQWPVKNARARLHRFMESRLTAYPQQRDMMAEEGTSIISPYLRFGLISIRECARLAVERPGHEKWLGELIWRDFYAMILYHYPETVSQEFIPIYRGTLGWVDDRKLFKRFCEGMTGYPIVDAGMRQLLATGWMHNRARMIVASFMTKDLRLDWRWGEEHFAQYLMDYEQASNVGGWQWAASTGTDAQPYFRVFNPTLQGQKFDPEGDYVRQWVPELAKMPADQIHEPWKYLHPREYPEPVVEHAEARVEAVAMFKRAEARSKGDAA